MPKPILASLVLALAVIGSYAVNGSIVEVWVMIGFGALGCAMKHFNLPREPLVLGLVLGTMAESELARAWPWYKEMSVNCFWEYSQAQSA